MGKRKASPARAGQRTKNGESMDDYDPYPFVEQAKSRVLRNSRLSSETLQSRFDF